MFLSPFLIEINEKKSIVYLDLVKKKVYQIDFHGFAKENKELNYIFESIVKPDSIVPTMKKEDIDNFKKTIKA